jgi:hypothetical protein
MKNKDSDLSLLLTIIGIVITSIGITFGCIIINEAIKEVYNAF